MDGLLKDFDLEHMNPQQKALRRWRSTASAIRNRRRRFRYASTLAERAAAETKKREIQEKIRVAVYVNKAALWFIDAGRQTECKRLDKGRWFLLVLFLALEAISVVLDLCGKNKRNFLLAAFLLSGFGCIINICAFITKRTTATYKQKSEWQLAWVEVVFSVLQLVISFSQYILAVARVKISYIPSLFPLVFALLLVVFAFKKQKKVNNHDQNSHSQPETP